MMIVKHAATIRPLGISSAALACAAMLGSLTAFTPEAQAQAQYRQKISNVLAKCSARSGPAVRVTVTGIKSSAGKIRVQSYRGIKTDWLKKGRWLNRIEGSARKGSMTFCMPVSASGVYGIAVRHDVNGNGKTDIRKDGGAMSNNPSINIFNLGKPSYKKTRFTVGSTPKNITINMRYF